MEGSSLCEGGVTAARFIAHPRWDALPGFESSRAFRLRAVLALESLFARHPGRRIIVVTHSSVINAYLWSSTFRETTSSSRTTRPSQSSALTTTSMQ